MANLRRYEVSKCRSCGAEIIWIRTKAGKNMPCDAMPRYFAEADGGSITFVTPDGEVKHGECMEPGIMGYIPHWVTCPDAFKFRRR